MSRLRPTGTFTGKPRNVTIYDPSHTAHQAERERRWALDDAENEDDE